jgi:tRNA(Ile)-lysidine synthase TilS/MesJ
VPAVPAAATNGKKPVVVAPPKKIMKLVGQCVREWSMIEDGDRLCLGLSGGKDSLSLLHVLLALKKRAPIRFTIACATVDPQTASFDPSPLIPYMQSLGVTYHYLSQPIVEMATSRMQGDSLCAFCARFKRGLLYSCCRDNGYNKLVLAQHLDDFAESFLMSALHNGQMRTMKANYSIDAGDLDVIRPFAYVREHQTRQFALEAKLPVINENCPACFEQPKERARVKQLLAQEESMVPALFFNLRRALLPLMGNETYTAMAAAAEQVAARGQMRSNATREEKAPGAGAGAGTGGEEDEDEVEASATKRPRVECSKEGGCPVVFDEMFE